MSADPVQRMNADLAQRIAAAIDEAEKLADAAINQMSVNYPSPGISIRAAWILGVLAGVDGEVADYAAFWSPDRVLALIAADRRVLERHRPADLGRVENCCGWCCQAIRCCPAPCPDLLDLAARWGVTP